MSGPLSAEQHAIEIVRAVFQDVVVERKTASTLEITTARVGAEDGTSILEVSAPITVDITNSGANGLDVGAESPDTWYYIFLLRKNDGTTAGLLSANLLAPTIPGTYTSERLLGAVRNNSASDFRWFYQKDDVVKTDQAASVLATNITPAAFAALSTITVVPIGGIVKDVTYNTLLLAPTGSGNATTGFFSIDGSTVVDSIRLQGPFGVTSSGVRKSSVIPERNDTLFAQVADTGDDFLFISVEGWKLRVK